MSARLADFDSALSAWTRWQARREFARLRPDLYRSLAHIYGSLAGASQRPRLTEVLSVPAESLETRGQPAGIALAETVERMRAGEPLSQAIAPLAPLADTMTIAAYEGRSALGPMFERLAHIAQMQRELSRKLPALLMPLSYFGVMLALLAMFAFLLLPILREIGKVETWPPYARVFAYLSEFIANYPLQLLAGLVAIGVAYGMSLPAWTGAARSVADRTWFYAWYRDLRAADLLSGLAAQLDAGVKIQQALGNLRGHAPPYLVYWIDEIERGLVEDPSNPLAALRVPLLADETVDAIEMLRRGGSQPAPVIDQAGRDAYGTAIRRIEAIATSAGRIFLIATALMVVWAFLSMTVPIIDTVQKVQTSNRQVHSAPR